MAADFDPLRPDVIADPYPWYRRLREEEPVHWSGRYRTWFVAGYDDVAALFNDPRLSADRTAASKYRGPRRRPEVRTIGSDPPEHTVVRGLLMKGLEPAIEKIGDRLDELVLSLLDRIEGAVEEFLEEARLEDRGDPVTPPRGAESRERRDGVARAGDGHVDLIRDFAYPLPITVIAEMFAVPNEDRPQFQSWSHDIARGMDHFYSRSGAERPFARLREYFAGLVAQRRRRPGDDLLSRLLEVEEAGETLTDDEAVSLATALLFAGHETTVNLIGNGVLALLRHPAELERVRDDPRVAVTAVEELLRYDSPAQLIGRAAREPLELRGAAIAAGDAVALLLGSANRDARRFPEPDRLDVGRRPNPHLSFGLGPHFCAGASLSRLEARAAIPALLRRFPHLRLGPSPPVWRFTAVLRGLETLLVSVV